MQNIRQANRELRQIRSENRVQLRQIKEEHLGQFQLIQEEYREQLRQIKQDNLQELRQINEENREQLRQTRKENCEQLRQIKENHERLQKMEEKYNNLLQWLHKTQSLPETWTFVRERTHTSVKYSKQRGESVEEEENACCNCIHCQCYCHLNDKTDEKVPKKSGESGNRTQRVLSIDKEGIEDRKEQCSMFVALESGDSPSDSDLGSSSEKEFAQNYPKKCDGNSKKQTIDKVTDATTATVKKGVNNSADVRHDFSALGYGRCSNEEQKHQQPVGNTKVYNKELSRTEEHFNKEGIEDREEQCIMFVALDPVGSPDDSDFGSSSSEMEFAQNDVKKYDGNSKKQNIHNKVTHATTATVKKGVNNSADVRHDFSAMGYRQYSNEEHKKQQPVGNTMVYNIELSRTEGHFIKEGIEDRKEQCSMFVALESGDSPYDSDLGSSSEKEFAQNYPKKYDGNSKKQHIHNKVADATTATLKKEHEEGKERRQDKCSLVVTLETGGPLNDPGDESRSKEEAAKCYPKTEDNCATDRENAALRKCLGKCVEVPQFNKHDCDTTEPQRENNVLCGDTGKHAKRNSLKWTKDAEVWNVCIERENVEEAIQDAISLLNTGVLPDQDILDRTSLIFDKYPEVIQNICTAICCYIKESSSNIIRVWASHDYREGYDKNKITFVLFTENSSEVETKDYLCYIRCVDEISERCLEENSYVRELEQTCSKIHSEAEKIKACLNMCSKTLMETHTNITKLSISWYKSKGFKTENQSVTPKPCVAVYVQTKGLIPLNETALPEMIDEIEVDVRESVVMSYAFPNDHHEQLKMGCAVHGGLKTSDDKILGGTLGGFFEVEGKIYCISCAHIFLSGGDMKKLKNVGTYHDLGSPYMSHFEAYQPVQFGARAFGEGIRAVYKEGGNGEPGVEAVIIRIDDRIPSSGRFPESPCSNPGFNSPKSFSSGKIYNRKEVNRLVKEKRLTVLKFGCVSGWTRGCFQLDCVSVRLSNMVGPLGDFGFLLMNQYEIQSVGNTKFAEYGDSGALVFTEENDDLTVIGIVEGGDKKAVYVTPICELFAALGLQIDRMKAFRDIHSPMSASYPIHPPEAARQITDGSDSGVSMADDPLHITVEERFKVRDQEMAQEFAKYAHDIKDSVNASVDAKLSPVKSELQNLKSEVRTVKTELEKMRFEMKDQTDSLKRMLQDFFGQKADATNSGASPS